MGFRKAYSRRSTANFKRSQIRDNFSNQEFEQHSEEIELYLTNDMTFRKPTKRSWVGTRRHDTYR